MRLNFLSVVLCRSVVAVLLVVALSWLGWMAGGSPASRAVNCIAIITAVFLTMALATSALMNWFSAPAALPERFTR